MRKFVVIISIIFFIGRMIVTTPCVANYSTISFLVGCFYLNFVKPAVHLNNHVVSFFVAPR